MSQLVMTQLGTGYAIWTQLGDVLITAAWVAFVLSLIVVCALGTHLLVITGTFLANRKKGEAIQAQLASIPLPADLPR